MTDPEIQNLLLGLNIIATIIAVVSAPIIANKVSHRLQERAERQRTKLTLLGTLLSLRHDFLSYDAIKAYNLIDAVFSDEPEVREAWTRLFAVLNDVNISKAGPIGNALVEEKRRELIMAMSKTIDWTKSLTSADILRAYSPGVFTDSQLLNFWKARMEKHEINEKAKKYGYGEKPYPDIDDHISKTDKAADTPSEDKPSDEPPR